MAETIKPCPFCGGEAKEFTGEDAAPHRWTVECDSCGAHVGSDTRHKARAKWNRRAERTWHDFTDELPPVGSVVLCRGKNGALYVGKPVTFKGNVTRKVWVPRGDQYRTPEKWMEVSA